MRKLWYAGAAVASGVLLFAASPARADPARADVEPAGARGGAAQSSAPSDQLPWQQSTEGLPAADAPGPRDPGSGSSGRGSGSGLSGGLLDQLPLLSGVMPNGRQQSFESLDRPTRGQTESASSQMPLLGGLGGALPVNGLPSVPGGDVPDVTGLPGGGMAVLAPAIAGATDPAVPAPTATAHAPHAAATAHAPHPAPTATATAHTTHAAPAATAHPATTVTAHAAPTVTAHAAPTATAHPAPTATAHPAPTVTGSAPVKHKKMVKRATAPAADLADPRVHEEPIDGEAARRTFSPGGRPVAGSTSSTSRTATRPGRATGGRRSR